MTANPDILLAAVGAFFVALAAAVALLAYRYGRFRQDGAGDRHATGSAADAAGPHTGERPPAAPLRAAGPPAGERPARPVPPAPPTDGWTEAEAVMVNSLQGKIIVSVVAHAARE